MTDSYEIEPTRYRLTFEERPGMEVVTRAPALGELLDIMTLYDSIKSTPVLPKDKVEELFGWFATLLDSWNLTRNGQPVPATYEGVKSLELGFIFTVVMTWVAKIAEEAGISPPAQAPAGANGTATASGTEAGLDLPMAPVSS